MSPSGIPDETAGRRGCPGWLKLLLVLSLAGNLAVVGLAIGQSMQHGHGKPDAGGSRARGPDRIIDAIVAMVPEERQDFARAHFDALRDQLSAGRADRGPHLAAVVEAMVAEPFDAGRLQSALDTMFDSRGSGRDVVRERMVSLVGELTPDERAVFADRFSDRMADGGSGRREN